jgi:hypothetical protein
MTEDAATPPFAPHLFIESGSNMYEDGRVWGAYAIQKHPDGKTKIVIFDWESHDPGKGHTTDALTWLNEKYDGITATGIGELDANGVGDISTAYWKHMREKGLVENLILSNGEELPTDHVWGAAPAP